MLYVAGSALHLRADGLIVGVPGRVHVIDDTRQVVCRSRDRLWSAQFSAHRR